jgi:hypothetical protein
VHHDIGGAQRPHGGDGEKVGITWSGPDERHPTFRHRRHAAGRYAAHVTALSVPDDGCVNTRPPSDVALTESDVPTRRRCNEQETQRQHRHGIVDRCRFR